MENKINVPFWTESCEKDNYPTLDNDLNTDVLIIGGGISGLTCAYLLKKQGFKVALIEANEIISGTSSHTTAKITAQHGLRLNNLIKRSGRILTKAYAEANTDAIDLIEKLAKEINTECDFKRTFACVITEQDKYIKAIEKEAESAIELGIKAEFIFKPQFEATKNANIKAAVKFYNQAQFNPVKYLRKLAQVTNGEDCKIFEQTRAVNIIKGKPNTVITDKNHKITAKKIVIATHFPFYDKKGLYFTRLYTQRSYICSFTAHQSFNEGMFITAENGYSLKSQIFNNENLILIAGGSHDTGCGGYHEINYFDLQKKAERLFKVKEFLWQWSAQDYATPDEMPYAGLLSPLMPDVYVMTGYDKWGMTNGTAAAVTVSGLIAKGESCYADVFNPRRFVNAPHTVVNYLKNNIKTVYRLISGRLQKLTKKADIKKGESRLININGIRAGVYRDNEGIMHVIKSTCRHMGCQLKFNDAEKTWDCPCHGSRYDVDGKIIEAPTNKPLESLKKE